MDLKSVELEDFRLIARLHVKVPVKVPERGSTW